MHDDQVCATFPRTTHVGVEFKVWDSGIGINSRTKERVYTTDGNARGTSGKIVGIEVDGMLNFESIFNQVRFEYKPELSTARGGAARGQHER
jgi:hypothetical protein